MRTARFVVFCSMLLLVLVYHCMAAEGRVGCRSGSRCLIKERARAADYGSIKVAGVSKEVFKALGPSNPGKRGEDLVSWDMRWVPSGPDPLHHNGSPKKPQTP